MSWFVMQLLRDKLRIKEENNIDSDDYNNLLLVEKSIDNLLSLGALTGIETKIIDGLVYNLTLNEQAIILGISRKTVAKITQDITDKVAYRLGDVFTDAGYINYMADKYKLTDEQVEKMIRFMESKFKSKILRIKNEK